MQQYDVKGMSCAACSARVEKAVTELEGVTACNVNLLTNSMGVEGIAAPQEIMEAVARAGYSASVKGGEGKAQGRTDEDPFKDTETPKILRRLIASLVFLLILMYFSMGHMLFGFPIPPFFEGNHAAMGLLQMLLAGIVMVINQKFFVSGFRGLLHLAPNMDTLVALGSGISFVYSTVLLFLMTGDTVIDGFGTDFYFESAAMILTLITVGKLLEARSKGKTTNALKGLMKLAPKTAVRLTDGVETEVPVEELRKGDIFIVRAGGSIPVDGVVLDGAAAVDESALTGESVPVDKEAGCAVSAATINRSGYLKCEATRVGEDTTLSQIIKMVSDASATKAPIAKIADKVSGIFVPTVISVAVITAVVWLLLGQSVGFALARAISVLVISCPCALGLATPVAIMVGSGVGARNGILFKTAVSLEETGKIQTVALDKTGTITQGEPVVTDIVTVDASERELLQYAASVESKSEHPLAKAVLAKAQESGITLLPTERFTVHAGNGIEAELDGIPVCGGNRRFIERFAAVPASLQGRAEELSNQGKTPLYFSVGNKLSGVIAVADVLKPDSAAAIADMKRLYLRVVMLTGDNERTAAAIGAQAGVDEVIADVLPDGKESVIRDLKTTAKTAMVGDGINDAPALTGADVGVAIGAGTDIAIDAADVVLVNSRLSDVPAAIRLGRATLRNIRENLFWAFVYNIIGIPLAAGVFIPLFGWQLNPMFGAAAMSLSSFCVVTNALRLNFVKLRPKDGQKDGQKDRQKDGQKYEPKDGETDRNIIPEKNQKSEENQNTEKENTEKENTENENTENENTEKEKTVMKDNLKIEGMMCPHCEARVKNALEALPEVEAADVSHEKGSAEVTLSAPLSHEALKAAVEAQGYKVLA